MTQPHAELSRLREIGWAYWDPIGLAGCPRDEYDSYLLHVVGRLRRNGPIADVTSYLVWVETDRMGLGEVSAEVTSRANKVVVLINEYLTTLPAGRLRIR
jgi:hypothetical protein